MHQQIIAYKAIRKGFERHQNLIQQLELRQKQLPKGSLIMRNHNYYRAITYQGKREQILISAGYQELVGEMQERQYISKALPILKKNLHSYEKMLNELQIYDPEAIRRKMPVQYHSFDFTKIALAGDVDPHAWAAAPYAHNTLYPENLKYRSKGGLATRSKAEADIATRLEQMGLVFRYEPILHLGKHRLSPDFCVLHPLERQQVYWEHFGMMDNLQYADGAMNKLRIYADYGYQLGGNLIMTWETGESPLTFQHIDERLNTYFSTTF